MQLARTSALLALDRGRSRWGRRASLARPDCTVRVSRSSTISMPASFWSQKSSASCRMVRASSLASSRMRWATELAWRTISVRCTMRSAWARTSSISVSASRVRSARNSSRSRRSQRAWRNSSGRRSRAARRRPTTSSRETMTEEESGIDLALSTMSSTWEMTASALTSCSDSSMSSDTGPSLLLPVLLLVPVLFASRSFSNFLTRCSATTLGTNAETSPPKWATSRTSLEAMNEYLELVGMKMVSTPERWWFIWAICISVSKSETARSPRTMAEAPTSRATLTSRVDTETMRTEGMCATTSSSMLLRSSRSKSAELFCGLRRAATTTSSKRRLARSTISRCPL